MPSRTILRLATCPNLRDIGGVRTLSGRTVRTGALYRSGSLHLLDDGDADAMCGHVRPRTLIDLRTSEEVERFPVTIALGAKWVHTPFSTAGAREWMERIGRWSLFDAYVGLARSSGDAIRRVIETLTEPGALPAVFFCAAGKDRTGITAAIVLSALLVPEGEIIDDYIRTGCIDLAMLGEGYASKTSALPREFYESPPEAMRAFLASIDHEFGSVRAYLATLGVTVAQLRALERVLLVD